MTRLSTDAEDRRERRISADSAFEFQHARPTGSAAILNFAEHLFRHSDKRDRPEIQALVKWVEVCSVLSEKHYKKARGLRAMHLLFVTVAICCSACTTVLSLPPVLSQGVWSDTLLSISVLGALSAIATGMDTALDPAGRRKEHLRSEFDYSILARDIAVFLTTAEADLSPDQDPWGTAVVRFQRRLDNVESMAPPV